MELSSQVIVFLEACLLGFLLGAVYDVFRIMRLAFPNGKILIFLEDVLYFAFITVVSFVFIVTVNGGVLRAFVLIGELLGAILYFFTLSIIIMKAAGWIIHCIKSIFLFLYRITIKPLYRFFCLLFKKCLNFCYFLKLRHKIIALNTRKHLKPPSKVVYNTDKQLSQVPKRRRGMKNKWQRKSPKSL